VTGSRTSMASNVGRVLVRQALAARAFTLRALTLLAALTAVAGGCDETYHREVSDEINILTRRQDALVPPALDRLVKIGAKAVPQMETAMHTAALPGRLALLTAFERIGSPASAAVLRHVALYDVKPEVRQRSEEILTAWTSRSERPALAAAAQSALAFVRQRRAAGEEPLLFGDAGVPGAPSSQTVGAPEPVGAALEKR